MIVCFPLSSEAQVVLEETTSQGPVDSQPMSVFQMMVSFEKKGVLDLKVTGHLVDRPPAVKRGEESDKIEVQHQAFSVFRPNTVTAKNCKSTNVAGLLGFKPLSSSQCLQLVWRALVSLLFWRYFVFVRWFG